MPLLGLALFPWLGAMLTSIPVAGPMLGALGTLLSKIPFRVYVYIALALGVLYYGHWRAVTGEAKGRAEVTAQVAKAAANELVRQTAAKNVIIIRERKRADESEKLNATLQKQVDDAIGKSLKSGTAGRLCLSADAVSRLRGLR